MSYYPYIFIKAEDLRNIFEQIETLRTYTSDKDKQFACEEILDCIRHYNPIKLGDLEFYKLNTDCGAETHGNREIRKVLDEYNITYALEY